MDKSKVLEKLNEILRHEWTGVAQYSQAGFVVTGIWREVYADLFFDSAKESFGHARDIGNKIVALEGVPTIERNQVKQSDDVMQLLEHGLEFEKKAVQLYTEAIEMAEDDRALVVFLENILEDEQEGVDHLGKLLRGQKAASGAKTDAASKAG